MPTYLKDKGSHLAVVLGKFKGAEFQDALARVKAVPGRRWNPRDKTWDFPRDAETALRIMLQTEPVVDAAVQSMVREHQAEVAESLVSRIDSDARIEHPLLNHMLFGYQRAYVDWTQRHPHNILADDMGIGKTIQAYGAWREWQTRTDTNEHPALVVVPNGQRGSWRDEIRFGPRITDEETHELLPVYEDWPGATVQVLTGANPAKRQRQLSEDAEVFVTNWEKLRSDAPMLAKRDWSAIIADEAHRAKNWKAQQTKGLWKLRAPMQLALTGTPVMNHPGELWPLLAWLFPDVYSQQQSGGGYWAFHYSYIDDYETKHGRVMKGLKNVDQLRFELADKLVRRTKKEVLPDLPEKLPPERVAVEFNTEERKLYQEAEKALFLDIGEYAVRRFEEANAESGGLLPKADWIEDYLANELADMPLERLERMIPNGAARITLLRQITAQAKARIAVERIVDNRTTPIVTFTWHVPPAKWIAEALEKQDIRAAVIAGAGGEEPSEIAKRFQAHEYDQIICTIAKGGTGLDLFRSSNALFVEEDWTPARNDQAIDRLHRKGQKNVVSQIRLYVPDTVDDQRVAPKNTFKTAIVSELFGV